MLDTLSDMDVSNEIMKAAAVQDEEDQGGPVHLLDQRFTQLGVDELEPLSHQTNEFKQIKDYLTNVSPMIRARRTSNHAC